MEADFQNQDAMEDERNKNNSSPETPKTETYGVGYQNCRRTEKIAEKRDRPDRPEELARRRHLAEKAQQK